MIQKILFVFLLALFNFKGYSQNKENEYEPIKNQKIKNNEFAEVLGICELEASKINNEFSCRIFSVLNGPSNPEIEGCNRSTNFYISNAIYELPEKYNLFKIGSFYETVKVELISNEINKNFKLIIHHKKSEKTIISSYLIDFNIVKKK